MRMCPGLGWSLTGIVRTTISEHDKPHAVKSGGMTLNEPGLIQLIHWIFEWLQGCPKPRYLIIGDLTSVVMSALL